MDELGWLMIAVGAMFVALGLIALLGLVGGLSRHEGQGPLLLGVGSIVTALARVSGGPADGWLPWLGVSCFVAGAVLVWRSGRRKTSAHRQPTADPPQ